MAARGGTTISRLGGGNGAYDCGRGGDVGGGAAAASGAGSSGSSTTAATSWEAGDAGDGGGVGDGAGAVGDGQSGRRGDSVSHVVEREGSSGGAEGGVCCDDICNNRGAIIPSLLERMSRSQGGGEETEQGHNGGESLHIDFDVS